MELVIWSFILLIMIIVVLGVFEYLSNRYGHAEAARIYYCLGTLQLINLFLYALISN